MLVIVLKFPFGRLIIVQPNCILWSGAVLSNSALACCNMSSFFFHKCEVEDEDSDVVKDFFFQCSGVARKFSRGGQNFPGGARISKF